MGSRCSLLRLNSHFAFYRTSDSQNGNRKTILFLLIYHVSGSCSASYSVSALVVTLFLLLLLFPALFDHSSLMTKSALCFFFFNGSGSKRSTRGLFMKLLKRLKQVTILTFKRNYER